MIKLKGPRPKFEDPEVLVAVINGYFAANHAKAYTVTGLALAIGTSRQTLDKYAKKPGFAEVIAEARLIIEHSYEMKLSGTSYKGAMFALKNMGWEDKQDSNITFETKDGKPPKWDIEVTHVDTKSKTKVDG